MLCCCGQVLCLQCVAHERCIAAALIGPISYTHTECRLGRPDSCIVEHATAYISRFLASMSLLWAVQSFYGSAGV